MTWNWYEKAKIHRQPWHEISMKKLYYNIIMLWNVWILYEIYIDELYLIFHWITLNIDKYTPYITCCICTKSYLDRGVHFLQVFNCLRLKPHTLRQEDFLQYVIALNGVRKHYCFAVVPSFPLSPCTAVAANVPVHHNLIFSSFSNFPNQWTFLVITALYSNEVSLVDMNTFLYPLKMDGLKCG